MLRPRRLCVLSAACTIVLYICLAGWFYDTGLDQVLYRAWYYNGMPNSSEAVQISCYYDQSLNTLQELGSSVPADTSIFFLETSCHPPPGLHLTARQACAVESAAKANPGSQVYLLFPSPVVLETAEDSATQPAYIQQLLSYPNVQPRHINMDRYFKGTPLQEWYEVGTLRTSRWPMSHASDVLRYLTLWKYGGIYLDLDVVVTKPLTDLVNYAGAESWEDVAAGVLSLATEGVGHAAADLCVMDLRNSFRGWEWGNNGPGVITRVLRKICNTDDVKEMTPERCRGFTVFPPETFYPIPWRKWALYFNSTVSDQTMERLKDSRAIHVWNKFSTTANVTVGSRQPYGLIASRYCPRVYSHAGDVF